MCGISKQQMSIDSQEFAEHIVRLASAQLGRLDN